MRTPYKPFFFFATKHPAFVACSTVDDLARVFHNEMPTFKVRDSTCDKVFSGFIRRKIKPEVTRIFSVPPSSHRDRKIGSFRNIGDFKGVNFKSSHSAILVCSVVHVDD